MTHRHLLATTAFAALACTLAGTLHAQDTNAAGTANAPSDIVVTGSAKPERRFDVAYAVNVLSQKDVQKIAPKSMADLLSNVPGIQVEETGGEVQNITRLRGIPTDRGYLLFQQDGLPLFQELDGYFFNGGDGMNRYDLMTDHVEVVRGGPAPIYGSSAAGIVNNITVTGSDVTRGRAQITIGDTGLYRLDAYQAGPLGQNTYYAVGGFLRYHDGYRDNGFPNDRGGQIRANIKHDLASGGSIKLSGMYVNDHNVFYLPIPIANPTNPSQSLNPYINFFSGTMNSPVFENTTIKYRDGSGNIQSINRDLSNGRYMNFFNAALDYEDHFGSWNISAKTGFTKGKTSFDALYSTTNPVDANTFANSYLTAARAAFGSGVTSLGYAVAGTNGATKYNPYALSGLVMSAQYRATNSNFYSWQADASASRQFDTGLGHHDLKLGVYGSIWGETEFGVYQDYLIPVTSQPQTLDLLAYGAAGQVLGSVTDNGALHDASNLVQGNVDSKMIALYANDTWDITDKLRIDAGIRQEWYHYNGWAAYAAATNLGNAATLADDTTQGFTGATKINRLSPSATNWTVGANYDLTKRLGAYVRASRLVIPPTSSTMLSTSSSTIASKATQYEAGLKAQAHGSYLYLTGFYTKFSPLNSSFAAYNPATGLNNQTVTFISDVVTKGIEGDGHFKVNRLFSIDASVTVQDPQYKNLTSGTSADLSVVQGKQIIRDPKIYGHVRPTFDFDAGPVHAALYGSYEFVGRRFVDASNNTALPAYGTFGAGLILTKDKWLFQVVADNLTNAKGLTEGNTRTDTISGQGTADAVYGRPIFGRNVRVILSKSW
ncbi:MAG: TonB-dependent receptor [Sphingomonadales bacterium]|nr:TonB-dependent receptor [Sphingomonadales bacterium]MDE2171046.1 TonB-dependent receptor [Sphingomonadales bacterium]